MKKNLKLIKLFSATVFCIVFMVFLLLKPFVLTDYYNMSENVSIFSKQLHDKFFMAQAVSIIFLLISFIILITLIMAIISEFVSGKKVDKTDKKKWKFYKMFEEQLVEKDVAQLGHILVVMNLLLFLTNGSKYRPTTTFRTELSCLTDPYFVVLGLSLALLIVINLGHKKKDLLNDKEFIE